MDETTSQLKMELLQNHPIFAPLEPPIIEEIMKHGELVSLKPGDLIIEEEASARKEFYLLIKGELEAFKTDKQGRNYSLNTMQLGAVFGESIILGETGRTLSVRAITKAEVLCIPNELIEQFSARYPQALMEFSKNLHKQTIGYLNKVNSKATELINTQKNINFFLVNIVVFLSLFAILVPYISTIIKVVYPSLITTPLVFIGSILVFTRLRSLGLPLSVVGITRDNLQKSLIEASLISAALLLVIIGLKFCLIHFTEQFSSMPLFLPAYKRYELARGVPMGWPTFIASLLLYACHAVFQEIIARGSLQGIIKQVFPAQGQYWSIILASLVFASAHAYFGIPSVLVVFLPGLFWGWLFYRQKNIFGAIISHIIIGIGCLGFIGWSSIPS